MHWLYLAIAIAAEVLATSFLKTAAGFSRLWPTLLVLAGYGVAFWFLSLTLERIPVGVGYAIWSGAGVTVIAAIRLALEAVRQRHGPAPAGPSPRPPIDPGRAGALGLIGGVVGLLSGLTGVGGGVFLTPLLLALRAAPVRTVAATSAAFILVNSLAGLAGGLAAGRGMPLPGVPLVAAAAAGGLVGSSLGAFRLPVTALTFLMAAVLAIAAAKSLL
ncbi:MAG: SMR family transporter [Planctomycetota bacterium]